MVMSTKTRECKLDQLKKLLKQLSSKNVKSITTNQDIYIIIWKYEVKWPEKKLMEKARSVRSS